MTTNKENQKSVYNTGQNHLSHKLVIKLGTDIEIITLENQIKELKEKKHQENQNDSWTIIDPVLKPGVSKEVKKRIALVAHNNLKQKMVDWCRQWQEELSQHWYYCQKDF